MQNPVRSIKPLRGAALAPAAPAAGHNDPDAVLRLPGREARGIGRSGRSGKHQSGMTQ